jgi:hypothetical protein
LALVVPVDHLDQAMVLAVMVVAEVVLYSALSHLLVVVAG